MPPSVSAEQRAVLSVTLPVARLEGVLQEEIRAAMDQGSRASKHQNDLADISRILESYPQLRPAVPDEIIRRLLLEPRSPVTLR